MIPSSFFPIKDTPCEAGDWTLIILIVTILMQLLVMGPELESYKRGLASMYRFKNPDGDIHFPAFSHFNSTVAVIASCSGCALLLSCILPGDGPDQLLRLLSFCGLLLAFFLLRLVLYASVNGVLYRKQTITVKPIRWNAFFIMVFSFDGLISSVFAMVSIITPLPPVVPLVALIASVTILETGCIFKLKTSLLRNRCSILGFISYLCALELGPLAVLWLVLA